MVNLVVKYKIKKILPKEDKDLRISADLADALDKKLTEILKEAAKRAKANHRTTIMAQDL